MSVLLAIVTASCSGNDQAPAPAGTDSGSTPSAGGASASADASLDRNKSGTGGSRGGAPTTDAATDAAARGDAKVSDGAPAAVGRGVFTMDRGTFFGATRCSTAAVQLCEDFESGTIRSLWSVDGTPVVDGTDHARGTHALHITHHGNGRTALNEKVTFPALDNTYYGLMFVKFAAYSTAAFVHWTAAAATGTGVNGEIRVGGFHDSSSHGVQGSFWGVGTDGDTGDWTWLDGDPSGKPRTIPKGEWMCVEWLHDGKNNETKFWWDEVEHPSLHTTPSQSGSTNGKPYVLPQFQSAWIGYQAYQAPNPPDEELWIDEVAIDPARIGCSI